MSRNAVKSEKVIYKKENAFFVASNSTKGFHSFYPECFERKEIKRIYAIKGGPGTGKSRFMRDVAKAGEENGYQCDYIYCSSDPNSLDGVILWKNNEGKAYLDATAPHVYEPKTPGVREEIINLGEFWDSDVLSQSAETLKTLNLQKSEGYRNAYAFLSAYGEAESVRSSLVLPFLQTERLKNYTKNIIATIPAGEKFEEEVSIMRSIGMGGRVLFDTFFANANKLFLVDDCRGISHVFFKYLYEFAKERKMAIRVSHDPIIPERIDGIFFKESGTAFVSGKDTELEYEHKTVLLSRFLSTDQMGDQKLLLNASEELRRRTLVAAISSFQVVKKAHFEIESIYSAAMDFQAKEKFTEAFCKKI